MEYPNGGKFEGNYLNGLKSGKGTFTYNNGDKYVGDFKNNKKDGFGKFYFADKRYYDGKFKNDKILHPEEILKKDNLSIDNDSNKGSSNELIF